MYYYHATYRSLIDSIREKGLGGAIAWHHWDISRAPEVDHPIVCLAGSADEAESFAETNEMVPEDEEIVVYRIEMGCLDPELLFEDPNVLGSTTCFEYRAVISYEFLEEVPKP